MSDHPDHGEHNPKKPSARDDALPSNQQKDPDDWVTGDERMTGAQASYLKTLSEEAGEDYDEGLTKAQASRRIDELQARTGRGKPASAAGGRDADPPAGKQTRPNGDTGEHADAGGRTGR